MMAVTELLGDHINRRVAKQTHVICIVETMYLFDMAYLIQTETDSFDIFFQELYQNYVIELQLNACVSSAVQCHLRYGDTRARFYPGYLTTIIPRFFKRN
eukprot:1148538_1